MSAVRTLHIKTYESFPELHSENQVFLYALNIKGNFKKF